MADSTVRITVSGYVQGVGFRYFVLREASKLGLTGYAENLPGGQVEIVASGDKGLVDDLVKAVRIGPRHASVNDIQLEEIKPPVHYPDFKIR